MSFISQMFGVRLSGVRLRVKFTPLFISRDTVVTKNKLEASIGILTCVKGSQGVQSLALLKTHPGANHFKLSDQENSTGVCYFAHKHRFIQR